MPCVGTNRSASHSPQTSRRKALPRKGRDGAGSRHLIASVVVPRLAISRIWLAARRIAEGTREKVLVTPVVVEKDLGAPHYRTDTEVADRTRRPGVAVGLAWTPVGGDVLFIEAGRMPGGNKGLIMTGQLGPVMQESVQAALTWVRGNATKYGIDPD